MIKLLKLLHVTSTIPVKIMTISKFCNTLQVTVFPPRGGTMALPHPLVLLPHTLILKFMLFYNTN